MAKTKEELNQLKTEYESLTTKLQELSKDELDIVSGGVDLHDFVDTVSKEAKKILDDAKNIFK